MNDTLRNRLRSRSENRQKFSKKFAFDQVIKPKTFEIEKISQVRVNSDKKGVTNKVFTKNKH
jgi:hypothetical protein